MPNQRINESITIYQFNILTIEQKQAHIWGQGAFLDNYITQDIRINCYAKHKFFVKVVYFMLLRNNHSFMYRVLTP